VASRNIAAAPVAAAQFRSQYDRLRSSVPWPPGDRRGALNYIGQVQVAAAAGLVSTGRTVSLAAPIEHEVSADNPTPSAHLLAAPASVHAAPAGVSFALDELSLHIHGNADSHLDALCHVIFDGTLYGDVPVEAVKSAGAGGLSVDVAGQGIVGRGVLLDIPRVRGVDWLEPGEHVTAAELRTAEAAAGVQVGTGDLLFVRVGHRRRRNELGPWDAASARAGLHPAAMDLLAEWRVAALGSDGNNDTAPSIVEGVDFPIHVLAVRALGIWLLDYLQLEDIADACEAAGRSDFLCVIAPLRLPDATGSPVNPIAVL
jgi:kynurenine formamidase